MMDHLIPFSSTFLCNVREQSANVSEALWESGVAGGMVSPIAHEVEAQLVLGLAAELGTRETWLGWTGQPVAAGTG